jgi:HD-GYP domain-containing protein (c-di-GMP phosphodiesterase class II)
MRLVSTANLPDGAVLGRDVLVGRADGVPLLRAGARITGPYRSKLQQLGIRVVYVEDQFGAGIEPGQLVSTETRLAATRAVARAFEQAGQAMQEAQGLPRGALQSLEVILERILADVAASRGAAIALADLAAADGYGFQHAIDVTALGLLIGQTLLRERGWIDWRGMRQWGRHEDRLRNLGLGLLLHDVGKLALPVAITAKATALNEAEWEVMRSHPRMGLELLRSDDMSPLVKAVVLRHHEHWDGSGYPDGKRGNDIHEMARIAAVANVYDAVTSERPGSPAQPAHVGVRTILESSGTLFDPDIVAVFARLVPPFPPGVELRLQDGRRAVVVSVPAEALDRPHVRVLEGAGAPLEISLLDAPELRIAGWDDAAAPALA